MKRKGDESGGDCTRNQRRPEHARNGGNQEKRARITVTSRNPSASSQMNQRETDERKLSQRQKQIDFGKNTIGYDRYIQTVPRNARKLGVHPMTPDKYAVISKRAWDGRIQAWRRQLHMYDPEPTQADAASKESTPVHAKVAEEKAPVKPTIEKPKDDNALFEDFQEDEEPKQEVDEDDLL